MKTKLKTQFPHKSETKTKKIPKTHLPKYIAMFLLFWKF